VTRSLRILWRAGVAIVLVIGAAGCAHSPAPGGPLPQFNGAYRILEVVESSAAHEVWPALKQFAEVRQRVTALMPSRAIGTVVVAPLLGSEYAEWKVHFDEPDHEIRVIVGPRKADGTFAVWRFEQTPAPRVRNDGTGYLEADAFVAEFAFLTGNSAFLRERWILRGDRVEFALEMRAGGTASPTRIGGFIAERD
jgi:hypothetical protein